MPEPADAQLSGALARTSAENLAAVRRALADLAPARLVSLAAADLDMRRRTAEDTRLTVLDVRALLDAAGPRPTLYVDPGADFARPEVGGRARLALAQFEQVPGPAVVLTRADAVRILGPDPGEQEIRAALPQLQDRIDRTRARLFRSLLTFLTARDDGLRRAQLRARDRVAHYVRARREQAARLGIDPGTLISRAGLHPLTIGAVERLLDEGRYPAREVIAYLDALAPEPLVNVIDAATDDEGRTCPLRHCDVLVCAAAATTDRHESDT